MKPTLFINLIIATMTFTTPIASQVKIGVFADCQYCDCETTGSRNYRNSLTKLNDCISGFNEIDNLDFIVGLGDLIDHSFSSFAPVNSILGNSEKEVFNVIGNHDFSVKEEYIDSVPNQLNLNDSYYTFSQDGWQFIFLNGNEITLQSNSQKVVKKAEKMVEKLVATNQPNYYEWNGGMGKVQIKWLEKQLKEAEKKQRKVVLFCHYPLLPNGAHTLWDSKKVLAVLNKHKCVKAWINGHNHAGDYACKQGVHFVTLRAMVETETENAFAVITFSDKNIQVNGFGREEDRLLQVN